MNTDAEILNKTLINHKRIHKKDHTVLCSVTRLCPNPCTVACQAPLSMGILQARILEWVAMPSSRGPSHLRDQTQVSALQADSLLSELPGKPKILEWVAYPFFRGSSRPRSQTGVSCIAGGFFTSWANMKLNLFQGHKDGSMNANQSMWYTRSTKTKTTPSFQQIWKRHLIKCNIHSW